MFTEDPALVQPCITVLRKLNAPLYSSLRIEKQVSCVYTQSSSWSFCTQQELTFDSLTWLKDREKCASSLMENNFLKFYTKQMKLECTVATC